MEMEMVGVCLKGIRCPRVALKQHKAGMLLNYKKDLGLCTDILV